MTPRKATVKKSRPRARWKLVSKDWGYLETKENQYGEKRAKFFKAEYFKMSEKE